MTKISNNNLDRETGEIILSIKSQISEYLREAESAVDVTSVTLTTSTAGEIVLIIKGYYRPGEHQWQYQDDYPCLADKNSLESLPPEDCIWYYKHLGYGEWMETAAVEV